ncbi:hypothetical protein KRR38_34940 [Novosphingobium sp. G106]|uniref:hypothetical protein n=1 Tax=Novosphingobium sp. G106 TaxID=2849500 RepID=UPI001C2D6302|nr:hypothetical protein [Novosphingobium sp. G106]MBV1692691.1 hypothetical protein [Novosphingobium sp. G106]
MPRAQVEILTDFKYEDRTMADPHEHPSRTSFDATTGDLIAAGIYGDIVRDNFDAVPSALRHSNAPNSIYRHVSTKRRLLIAGWFIAIFVISALVSPYILN